MRVESREAGVVCEWDPETGDVGVAFSGEGGMEMLQGLWVWLYRETGLTWDDLEIRERRGSGSGSGSGRCGLYGVLWRARVTPSGGADLIGQAIWVALGGVQEERELEG